MIKKVSLVLILLSVIISTPSFLSTGVDYTSEADVLKSYGLFNGTNNGYELEKVPTRVEAAAMFVKLLGKEDEAKLKQYKHPFTDVPAWANYAVGYMYENKFTTGMSANQFGSKQPMKAKDYTVFVLKALGYNDVDFTYATTLDFAEKIGLYDSKAINELTTVQFKRDEMVHVSFLAINAKMKETTVTLYDKLKSAGAIKNNSAVQTDKEADAIAQFLAGKTNRYEKTIKNIDTSGDTLNINTDVINFALKKETGELYGIDMSQRVVVPESSVRIQDKYIYKQGMVYQGKRFFPKTFSQWGDSIIHYNLAFYKKGVYQLSLDFTDITEVNIIEYGTNISFPISDFDQINLSATLVSDDFFGVNPDEYIKVYKKTDADEIMTLLRSGTSIRRYNLGTPNGAVTIDELKRFLVYKTFGGVHYPNGEFHKMGDQIFRLPDPSLPYTVEFESKHNGFTKIFDIKWSDFIDPVSVRYKLNVTNIQDNKVVAYAIYDEDFKIRQFLIITE